MAVTQLPRRIPRRDEQARAQLEEVAQAARPLVLARDRSVALAGALADLVPRGAVVRGTVLRVAGAPGAGATTVAFELAAAFTTLGEWAAAVDLDATLGPLAAAEAGVALERFAVVRRVPPARWATVVAALLDGVSLVLAEVPRGVRLGDARRLEARVREREAVLVATEPHGVAWPAGAAYVVHAAASRWEGLDAGAGVLAGRRLQVQVEGRGQAARPRAGELARAG
jgi:Mrp family chromosome partitioning ATPase